VTGGLLHLFSRKERAKRKQQSQQAEQLAQLQVPPAYKSDFYEPLNGPRSAYPRPLSSFAPDYSRQAHSGQHNNAYGHGGHYYPHQQSGSHTNHHGQYSQQQKSYQYGNQIPQPQQQQRPRASFDVPRYPALPTYDPSKYQPIRPSLTPTADRFAFHWPNARGQTSRLSEVHYNDARPSSIYYQPPAAAPDLTSAPPMPQRRLAAHARTQSIMPFTSGDSADQRVSRSGDGRERSISEPMPAGDGQGSSRGPRRPKPVLSRLITNFSG
jgi:hypothetical protein